jgi:hypothetical protein
VVQGHPVDHLHDDDGLAHPGPTEEADLPALHVGLEQVDDLDARFEHLATRLQGVEGGGVAVDVPPVFHRTDVVGVERFSEDVEHMAEDGITDGYGQSASHITHGGTPSKTVCRLQADTADPALADLLRHF